MKRFTLVLMLALMGAMQSLAAKVEKNVNIQIGSETRSYKLYVPNNVKANAPLVVSLHGAGGSMNDKSPMGTDIADSEGCIIVYPQGKLIYFPVFGGSVNGWDASGEMNEDVEFIKAVIEDVAKSYTIDRNRIYACGFSNGGMMTYALTNTCSDVFAAFASISGFPLNEFHFRHTGERPVPFLHIHGKADDFVKYSCMPVIVDEMVARLGANPVPVKTTVSGKYDKSIYEATDGSFEYVYYEMDGMGHSPWTDNTPEGSSSKTMWNHFKKYTLDTPCDATIKWMPRIETEGYAPKQHGWTVNASKTLLLFGKDQHKADNSDNNVYRSLQLDNGCYKFVFHSDGVAGTTFSVKLVKLTGTHTVVFNETVGVGKDHVFTFKIEDGWGEYRLTMTREKTTDAITITNIGLFSCTEEEVLNVNAVGNDESTATAYYNLAGIKLKNSKTQELKNLPRGINIIRSTNGKAKKVMK